MIEDWETLPKLCTVAGETVGPQKQAEDYWKDSSP